MWHYHVKDIAGTQYKIKQNKTKNKKDRTLTVSSRGQTTVILCSTITIASHCRTTTKKVQSSAHDGKSSATVHSWQTTAGCSTNGQKPVITWHGRWALNVWWTVHQQSADGVECQISSGHDLLLPLTRTQLRPTMFLRRSWPSGTLTCRSQWEGTVAKHWISGGRYHQHGCVSRAKTTSSVYVRCPDKARSKAQERLRMKNVIAVANGIVHQNDSRTSWKESKYMSLVDTHVPTDRHSYSLCIQLQRTWLSCQWLWQQLSNLFQQLSAILKNFNCFD